MTKQKQHKYGLLNYIINDENSENRIINLFYANEIISDTINKNFEDGVYILDYIKEIYKTEEDLKFVSGMNGLMGMMGDRTPIKLKDTDIKRILKDEVLDE